VAPTDAVFPVGAWSTEVWDQVGPALSVGNSRSYNPLVLAMEQERHAPTRGCRPRQQLRAVSAAVYPFITSCLISLIHSLGAQPVKQAVFPLPYSQITKRQYTSLETQRDTETPSPYPAHLATRLTRLWAGGPRNWQLCT
jgi:hypothetical protein